MTPGYMTSEFWVMLTTKVLVLLVTAGVLSQAKSDTISALLAQAITGATAVWALATMAKSWIEHRSNLKAATAMSAIPDPPGPGAAAKTWGKLGAGLILACFLLSASPAWAQDRVVQVGLFCRHTKSAPTQPTPTPVSVPMPSQQPIVINNPAPVAPTPTAPTFAQQATPAPTTDPALLSRLDTMIANQQLMIGLMGRQQPASIQPAVAPVAAPAIASPAPVQAPVLAQTQPLVVVVQPSGSTAPLQALPVAGAPLQINLPVTGAPVQTLPVAGAPVQTLPVAGVPVQQLPVTGRPVQTLPAAGAPVQQLNPSSAPVQQLQPAAAPAQQMAPVQLAPTPTPATIPATPSGPPAIVPLPQQGAPQQNLSGYQPTYYTTAFRRK